jgi:hypothetical protein
LLKAARNREGATPLNELMNVLGSIAHWPIKKYAITNLGVLNDAYAEPSLSRAGFKPGLRNLAAPAAA